MVIAAKEECSKPKLPYLRAILKPPPPPAVVVTDDSEVFPSCGGINPSVIDALFGRPFADSSPGVANGVCGNDGERLSAFDEHSYYRRDSIYARNGDAAAHTSLTFGDSSLENDPEQENVRVVKKRCCTEHHRRLLTGLLMTSVVAACWVGAAHLLKNTYRLSIVSVGPTYTTDPNITLNTTRNYNAPFFTTWFCTTWNALFFPIYLITRVSSRSEKTSARKLLAESIQNFQERGFSALQFFGRCGFFSLLWVITNYMFVHSLRLLDTTNVVALYSTNVSFVYLMSWVILHEQFVGIRIVAVILCNTGIALLAYMDGVNRSVTLGGVVLASAAAAGSATYKVFFRKLMGEVTFGQLSLFFTLVGLLNILLLWPLVLVLYFSGVEKFFWGGLPFTSLGGAAILSLVANILGNFGIIWTYEIFLTLGLVCAIPASAALDIYLYDVKFAGMKLAGIILIAVGFLLVLMPQNWTDYLTRILRWRRKKRVHKAAPPEQAPGHRSRLRTPSGLVK